MNKRIEYLDNAKGLLIILIILGHVFFKAKPLYFAYTFHLSSFFIITGILFAHINKTERPLITSFKNALYTLAVPFLFFEAVGGIVRKLFRPDLSLPAMLIGPFRGRYNVAANWYLQTAFVAELLLLSIEKIISNKRIKIIIYAALFAVGCLLPRTPFRYRFIDRALIATTLIAIGYYLHDFYLVLNPYYLSLSFILTALCTVFNGYVSLYSITVGNPILYIVGSAAGAYMCIAFCRLWPSRLMALIGRYSLILMGTHQLFIDLIPINRVLLLILILMAEVPITWIISRFLPFCAGIKPQEWKKYRSH